MEGSAGMTSAVGIDRRASALRLLSLLDQSARFYKHSNFVKKVSSTRSGIIDLNYRLGVKRMNRVKLTSAIRFSSRSSSFPSSGG